MKFINIRGETADGKSMILTSPEGTAFTAPKSEVLQVLQAISEQRMHSSTKEELKNMRPYELGESSAHKGPSVSPALDSDNPEIIAGFHRMITALDNILNEPDSVQPKVQEEPKATSRNNTFIQKTLRDLLESKMQDKKSIHTAFESVVESAVPVLSSLFKGLSQKFAEALHEPVTEDADVYALDPVLKESMKVTLKEACVHNTLSTLLPVVLENADIDSELFDALVRCEPDQQKQLVDMFGRFLAFNLSQYGDLPVYFAAKKGSTAWVKVLNQYQ